MKEKVANLKNLANSVLPSEEKNKYIQAQCDPNYFASNARSGTNEFGQTSEPLAEEDYSM